MLSPASLRREYLNETITARGGVRIRIVERPSRWMDDQALQKLVADVQLVVQRATPAGTLEYGVAGGDRSRLDSAILTLVYDQHGEPVGFNALSILQCELRGAPADVLHLGLLIVDPDHRSAGLSGMLYGLTAMLLFARRRLRPLWISNVTQVPAVYGMVAESFQNVFPGASRQTYDHLHLARQIMSRYRDVFGVGPDAQFDEETGIIRDAYTGGSDNLKKTFGESAQHRNPVYNEECRVKLDYQRGDDFLQIGQISVSALRAFFTRSASELAPTALMLRVAQLALESLVAPMWQWFAAETPMGDLRAAKGARHE